MTYFLSVPLINKDLSCTQFVWPQIMKIFFSSDWNNGQFPYKLDAIQWAFIIEETNFIFPQYLKDTEKIQMLIHVKTLLQ